MPLAYVQSCFFSKTSPRFHRKQRPHALYTALCAATIKVSTLVQKKGTNVTDGANGYKPLLQASLQVTRAWSSSF